MATSNTRMARGLGFRRAVLLTVLFAAVAMADGCRRETAPPPANTLTVGVENDLTNLDPIKSQEPYSLRVIGQIFEGLVTLNARNELEPALAKSWTHNDNYDTWTFEIRPGVYFHEDELFGPDRTREVTAQDVVESLQRIVSKDSYPQFVLADAILGVQAYQEGTADSVAGLRVTGPRTVEIRLQQPEPAFLHRLTSPWFCVFPREAVALGPDVFGRTKAVGTGPFKLVSRLDNEVVLAKNERYWRGDAGGYARLVFRVIKNEQIRLSELRNGHVDLMVLPLPLVPVVLEEPESANGELPLNPEFAGRFAVRSFPTFNSHFIGMNCEKMDVHLRRAVSLAIDRRELLRAVVHGAGVVATGTVPIDLLGYVPPYNGDIFDPARAVEELAKSSFDPSGDEIEILVHEKDNTEKLGQLVQAQLAKIGVRVSLERLDYNTVVGRMIQGDTEAFALALEYVFSAPEPILNNIFHSAKIPVPNFWRYSSSEVDRGLDDLRRIGDRSEANARAQKIEEQIIEDAPAAFLYQLSNLVIFREGIDGVSINGHSIPLLWEATPGG